MMSTDNSAVDELLARAILDLELKMKHEIRQTNAQQVAKIEKHSQAVQKKLTFLEAKLDGMNREVAGGGRHVHGVQHHHINGSSSSSRASSGRVFARAGTANLGMNGGGWNGISRTPTGIRTTSARRLTTTSTVGGSTSPIGIPFAMFHSPQSLSRPNWPPGASRKEKRVAPPTGGGEGDVGVHVKPTPGTGANRTELGAVLPVAKPKKQWTERADGIYTDEEVSTDDDDVSSTQSGDERSAGDGSVSTAKCPGNESERGNESEQFGTPDLLLEEVVEEVNVEEVKVNQPAW